MNTDLNLIIEDLKSKPLIIVADPGEGKTVIAKEVIYQFRESLHDNLKLQVFDPSGAWWYNSPLFMKQVLSESTIDAGIWRDESHTVYNLGGVETETRMRFVSEIATREYLKRFNGHLFNPEYLRNIPYVLYGWEEVQTLLPKNGTLPKHLFDVVTYGRNYKEIILAITQRLSECRTGLVERCNVLCGYISGDNDRSKLRRGTRWEFLNEVRKIKTKSYKFMYYNGDINGPYTVTERLYGDPGIRHNDLSRFVERKPCPHFMPTL